MSVRLKSLITDSILEFDTPGSPIFKLSMRRQLKRFSLLVTPLSVKINSDELHNSQFLRIHWPIGLFSGSQNTLLQPLRFLYLPAFTERGSWRCSLAIFSIWLQCA